MRSVNIHEAKTHLSRLVEQAAAGEPFIIAKSGKPIAKVTAIDAPARAEQHRIGFLQGEINAPEDFDDIGRAEIEQMFSG